jgi:hypothetical protein
MEGRMDLDATLYPSTKRPEIAMVRQVQPLRLAVCLVAVLGVLWIAEPSAQAQEDAEQLEAVVDGSAAGLNPHDTDYAITMVRQKVNDSEAKFRMLRQGRGGVICGEVTSTDAAGVLRGFSPFFADALGNRVEVMPGPESELFAVWLSAFSSYCP